MNTPKYTAIHTESLEILQADDFKVLFEAARRNWRYELNMWGYAQRIELGRTKGDSLKIDGEPIFVFEESDINPDSVAVSLEWFESEEAEAEEEARIAEIIGCKPDALGNCPCDYGFPCDKCRMM